MATHSNPIFLLCILIAPFVPSLAQNSCKDYNFPSNRSFNSCIDLPYLGSHLYWNYIQSNSSVQIAYRATRNSYGWIAWAINPTGQGMVGSQALLSVWRSNSTTEVFTTQITSYSPTLQPGNLSFPVSEISCEVAGGNMTIYATVGLPNNKSLVSQAWQEGPLVDGHPSIHETSGANLKSYGILDFKSMH